MADAGSRTHPGSPLSSEATHVWGPSSTGVVLRGSIPRSRHPHILCLTEGVRASDLGFRNELWLESAARFPNRASQGSSPAGADGLKGRSRSRSQTGPDDASRNSHADRAWTYALHMGRAIQTLVSAILGGIATIAYLLYLFPEGCADVDGVSSWDRCTSPMGTPAFSLEDFGLDANFTIILPLLTGVIAGFCVWFLIDISTAHGHRAN